MNCTLCPFDCRIDRKQTRGICRTPDRIMIVTHQLHYWEEPCLSGANHEGSGTIFFTHCNLRCVFCQNYKISQLGKGVEINEAEFMDMCLDLQDKGALNINLVSPTPYTNLLVETIKKIKPKLHIPIVWNSNAYEKVETLRQLEGLVDIWLPDLKYHNNELADKYSHAPDYFEYAAKAILEMRRQQTEDIFDKKGHLQKGLMIRHLMLPRQTEDSLKILQWIKANLGTQTRVNLMAQYYPTYQAKQFPEIDRRLTKKEYEQAVDFLVEHDFANALIQDLSSAESTYTPNF